MSNAQWIIEDFDELLTQLKNALEEPSEHDLIKAGCIQYFEFCFELAWKSIKIICTEKGLTECLSPRACLRQAFALNWVSNEASWLQMLDARNRMSHTYDAKKALEIYTQLPEYLAEMQPLLERLKLEVNT